MTKIENAIPILKVASLAKSIDFYSGVLGFKLDWQAPGMASVGRDAGHIMLSEGSQGSPGTWVWIGCEDTEPLYALFTARGAQVQMPPASLAWGFDMRILDPDGHVLRFASDTRSDRPIIRRGLQPAPKS